MMIILLKVFIADARMDGCLSQQSTRPLFSILEFVNLLVGNRLHARCHQAPPCQKCVTLHSVWSIRNGAFLKLVQFLIFFKIQTSSVHYSFLIFLRNFDSPFLKLPWENHAEKKQRKNYPTLLPVQAISCVNGRLEQCMQYQCAFLTSFFPHSLSH